MQQSVKFFYLYRKLAVPQAGTFPGRRSFFPHGEEEVIMRDLEQDQAPARYEAYELPPTDTFLVCFGLFIFTGVAAAFYVVLMGA